MMRGCNKMLGAREKKEFRTLQGLLALSTLPDRSPTNQQRKMWEKDRFKKGTELSLRKKLGSNRPFPLGYSGKH